MLGFFVLSRKSLSDIIIEKSAFFVTTWVASAPPLSVAISVNLLIYEGTKTIATGIRGSANPSNNHKIDTCKKRAMIIKSYG